MRFYHKIENRVYPHLRLMLQDPFMQFGKDIVYFFSTEHRTDWKPFVFYEMYNVVWKDAPKSYSPHHLSPFTKNVRRAMRLTIVNMEERYAKSFDAIVSVSGDEKLLGFVLHVYFIIRKHFAGDKSVFKLFFTVQYIARLSVFFHQKGSPDVAHIAVVLIALFLYIEQNSRTSENVFTVLDSYSKQLINGYEVLRKKRYIDDNFKIIHSII